MRERVRAIIAQLESDPPPLPADEVSEARAPARLDGGAALRLPRLPSLPPRARRHARIAWCPTSRSGLGHAQRAPRRERQPAAATVLRGDVRARAREPELLIVTKANSTATVHRGELPRLRRASRPSMRAAGSTASTASSGLWTSTAYHGSPRDIPVLRRKVERVIEHFGLDPARPRRQGSPQRARDLSARRAVPGGVAGSDPHRARRGQPVRAAHGAPAGAARSLSPLLLLPGVRAARPLQHRSAPAHRADRARRLRAARAWRATRRSPARATRACTSWCAPIPAGSTSRLRAASSGASREAALTWTDRLREVLIARARRGRGPRARRPLPAGLPARLPGGRRARPRRWATSPTSKRCARSRRRCG